MNVVRQLWADARIRPFLILAIVAVLFVAANPRAIGDGAFSVLQNFATIGPVALGVGLAMLIREFDISVVGMFSLAGCVAVMAGNVHPALGLALALAIGAAGGVLQALAMLRWQLASVAVTLGGLLTFTGIAAVLTGNRAISFDDIDLSLALEQPIATVFSPRNMIVIVLFLAAAFVVSFTRVGRDVIATGSARQASAIAGIDTGAIVVAIFGVSGVLAALAGALLSFSLAAASPSGLSDVLVPAVTSAILGGVSLGGGTGRPLGIAAGVLVLAMTRTGLDSLGVAPHLYDIFSGVLLLVVAVADAPDLRRQFTLFRRRLGWERSDPG
jgi:ribose/xylose/arabinose/galactoside ABC-type transport system permease subunit